jgi:hypothetical protein
MFQLGHIKKEELSTLTLLTWSDAWERSELAVTAFQWAGEANICRVISVAHIHI